MYFAQPGCCATLAEIGMKITPAFSVILKRWGDRNRSEYGTPRRAFASGAQRSEHLLSRCGMPILVMRRISG